MTKHLILRVTFNITKNEFRTHPVCGNEIQRIQKIMSEENLLIWTFKVEISMVNLLFQKTRKTMHSHISLTVIIHIVSNVVSG